MTEAQWLAATDPTPMLAFVRGGVSPRKLRLFLVASARCFWDHFPDGVMREAVEVVERYADGLASAQQMKNYPCRFFDDLSPGLAFAIASLRTAGSPSD
jgi:hypothetical protein